jgi:hypothetical protein
MLTRVLKRTFVFGLSELDNPLEPDWKVRLMIPGVLEFKDSDQRAGSVDRASVMISPKWVKGSLWPSLTSHGLFWRDS